LQNVGISGSTLRSLACESLVRSCRRSNAVPKTSPNSVHHLPPTTTRLVIVPSRGAALLAKLCKAMIRSCELGLLATCTSNDIAPLLTSSNPCSTTRKSCRNAVFMTWRLGNQLFCGVRCNVHPLPLSTKPKRGVNNGKHGGGSSRGTRILQLWASMNDAI
jgi:hypothetical protein